MKNDLSSKDLKLIKKWFDVSTSSGDIVSQDECDLSNRLFNDPIDTQEQVITKYHRRMHNRYVDVYDVLNAWDISNPAIQHLVITALQLGHNGRNSRKELELDLHDMIDAAVRAKELECS